MDGLITEAGRIVRDWKGASCIFGRGVLAEVGCLAARCGRKALLIGNAATPVAIALEAAKVELAGGKIVLPAGFTERHIGKALAAAKSPQLEMKLRNMPVPLTPATVDEYMSPCRIPPRG